MIFPADDFVFKPPRAIAFAHRVLIKPNARCAEPYPATTSRETLDAVIAGIRSVSGADIVLLERSAGPDTMQSIYSRLDYDFPRTMLLDVDQCVPVAVENPLSKPFAISTFWVPNVILSCDYLISIAPLKIVAGSCDLSISNLLGLLPASKYRREMERRRPFPRRRGAPRQDLRRPAVSGGLRSISRVRSHSRIPSPHRESGR